VLVTAPARNVHAELARAAKARKLIDAIDGVLPHIYARTPEMALGAVEGLGDAGWQTAANVAGVNLPSLETREIVLDTFRRRVQASVDAQIAASLRKAVG
jgi:hypothetical protein